MWTAIVPNTGGKTGFLDKAKDRVQDQKREYYSNDDYSFMLSHLFHNSVHG